MKKKFLDGDIYSEPPLFLNFLQQLLKSISLVPHSSRYLKTVILMDKVLDISLATKLGLQVLFFDDIIEEVFLISKNNQTHENLKALKKKEKRGGSE